MHSTWIVPVALQSISDPIYHVTHPWIHDHKAALVKSAATIVNKRLTEITIGIIRYLEDAQSIRIQEMSLEFILDEHEQVHFMCSTIMR